MAHARLAVKPITTIKPLKERLASIDIVTLNDDNVDFNELIPLSKTKVALINNIADLEKKILLFKIKSGTNYDYLYAEIHNDIAQLEKAIADFEAIIFGLKNTTNRIANLNVAANRQEDSVDPDFLQPSYDGEESPKSKPQFSLFAGLFSCFPCFASNTVDENELDLQPLVSKRPTNH